MAYYVIGDNGQKFGPADIPTLSQWAAEGRLMPHTMLEDDSSGGQIAASSIPAIRFPGAPQPAAPMTGAIYQPGNPPAARPAPGSFGGSAAGGSDAGLAIVLAIVSPFCTLFLPIGGLISSGAGFRAALRAKNMGHPLAILGIVLNGAAIAFFFIAIAMGLRFGGRSSLAGH